MPHETAVALAVNRVWEWLVLCRNVPVVPPVRVLRIRSGRDHLLPLADRAHPNWVRRCIGAKKSRRFAASTPASESFERRPDDIIKVYLTDDRTRHVSAMLKWCAANRRAYNVVPVENLERLSGSSHHEGIMILARKPTGLDDSDLLRGVRDQSLTGPFLYLDGLQNPHNLGAPPPHSCPLWRLSNSGNSG